MSDKYPIVDDRGDRVILRGDLAEEVILGVLTDSTEGAALFKEQFELDPVDYLGDPEDTFYQVIEFTRIITRRTDGKKFGHPFWASPGNDSIETSYDQDLEKLGVEVEYDDEFNTVGGHPQVFLPVEPFQRTGYKVA